MYKNQSGVKIDGNKLLVDYKENCNISRESVSAPRGGGLALAV